MSRGKKNQQHQEELEEDSRSSVANGEPGESEMMVMFRAMLAEQRRADETREERREEIRVQRELELADKQARIQREAEERREEIRVQRELELADKQARIQREAEERREEIGVKRELELADKQAEIQKELEKRQYEQQVSLLKLQQEMGEKASVAHREYQSISQKRDRALYTIPVLKEGEDVEEFLSTAERRLSAADVKKRTGWQSLMQNYVGRRLRFGRTYWLRRVATRRLKMGC